MTSKICFKAAFIFASLGLAFLLIAPWVDRAAPFAVNGVIFIACFLVCLFFKDHLKQKEYEESKQAMFDRQHEEREADRKLRELEAENRKLEYENRRAVNILEMERLKTEMETAYALARAAADKRQALESEERLSKVKAK